MPKKIDNYIIYIEKPLGEGSYGKVCLATDTKRNNIQRAVKIIQKNAIKEPYLMAAFRTEILILQQVKSKGTVRCYDVIQTLTNYYIVLEYCKGGDLRNQIKNYPQGMPVNQALASCKKILKSFRILVQKGIFHRDLKPQNILIHENMFKISDFGFSKASQTNYLKSSVGTPTYMAPQVLRKQKYTSKCDIWSFGIIMHQLLYGCRPIPTYISTINQILQWYKKQKEFNYQPLKCEQKLSKKIINCLNKCLQLDQINRLSWQQLFNHQIFKQEGVAFSNSNLCYIMNDLRLSIHINNIDMDRFFQKYSGKYLNEYNCLNILKLLSQDITLEDIREIMFVYGKKNLQNNQLQLKFQDLRGLFINSGIRMKSLGYDQIASIQNQLLCNMIEKIQLNHKEMGQNEQNINDKIDGESIIQNIKQCIKQKNKDLSQLYQYCYQNESKMDEGQLYNALKQIDEKIDQKSSNIIFKIFMKNTNNQITQFEFYKNICKLSGEPIRSIHQ